MGLHFKQEDKQTELQRQIKAELRRKAETTRNEAVFMESTAVDKQIKKSKTTEVETSVKKNKKLSLAIWVIVLAITAISCALLV